MDLLCYEHNLVSPVQLLCGDCGNSFKNAVYLKKMSVVKTSIAPES